MYIHQKLNLLLLLLLLLLFYDEENEEKHKLHNSNVFCFYIKLAGFIPLISKKIERKTWLQCHLSCYYYYTFYFIHNHVIYRLLAERAVFSTSSVAFSPLHKRKCQGTIGHPIWKGALSISTTGYKASQYFNLSFLVCYCTLSFFYINRLFNWNLHLHKKNTSMILVHPRYNSVDQNGFLVSRSKSDRKFVLNVSCVCVFFKTRINWNDQFQIHLEWFFRQTFLIAVDILLSQCISQ